jgi:hypothetical protein
VDRNRLLFVFAVLLLTVVTLSNPVVAQSGDTSAKSCIQHEQQDTFDVPTDEDVVVSINQTQNDSVVRYTFIGYYGDPEYTATLPTGVTVTDSEGFDIRSSR